MQQKRTLFVGYYPWCKYHWTLHRQTVFNCMYIFHSAIVKHLNNQDHIAWKMYIHLQSFSVFCLNMEGILVSLCDYVLKEVKLELLTIQSATNQLRTVTQKMAHFFCEDQHNFDLETTLQCLHRFCKQIKRCQNVSSMLESKSKKLQISEYFYYFSNGIAIIINFHM